MIKDLIISFVLVMAASAVGTAQVVVNSASYLNTGTVSSHELVTMFGVNLSAQTASASAVPLPTTLGGVKIRVSNGFEFDGEAELLFVSPSQINFVFPDNVGGYITLTVERNGVDTHTVYVHVEGLAPGVFTQGVSSNLKAFVGNVLAYVGGSYFPAPTYEFINGEYRLKPVPAFNPSFTYYLSIYATGIKYSNSPFKEVVFKNKSTGTEYRLTMEYSGPSFAYIGLDLVNVKISSLSGFLIPAGLYDVHLEYGTFGVSQVYKSNVFNVQFQ